MELRSVESLDARRLTGFDVFVGVAAVAVLVSLFLPWFVAEYEPHTNAARACFEDSTLNEAGMCTQSWSGWRTISVHWAIPIGAFIAFPAAARRVLGERHCATSREWLTLAGVLVGVAFLSFFLTPNLDGLNAAQAYQAALYSAEPWVYTSVHYARGIYSALGFAFTAFVAAGLRTHTDPDGHIEGRSHGALIVLALVGALFPIAYLGEVLTRF
ncbi:MAG: hypothetical protein OER12_02715 [Acidimicrobiia bacterium]|nr:hypothetical protein [Acidimicrobiia bacterium]